MKVIVNIIILAIIVVGAVYFYEQNRDELNETLEDLKNTSVESVTEKVVEKVKNIDPDELVELLKHNKDKIQELVKDNNIDLENIDMDTLKDTLKDSGIDLSEIDLSDSELQKKIKDIVNSSK